MKLGIIKFAIFMSQLKVRLVYTIIFKKAFHSHKATRNLFFFWHDHTRLRDENPIPTVVQGAWQTPFPPLGFLLSSITVEAPYDHSHKRPALVTTTFVKPRLNCDFNFAAKSSPKRTPRKQPRPLLGLPNWTFPLFLSSGMA